MSHTHHHDRKGFHPWETAKKRVPYWRHVDYSSAGPGWWRRMMMEKRARRQAHLLERRCVTREDVDRVEWPHPRKPTQYYY